MTGTDNAHGLIAVDKKGGKVLFLDPVSYRTERVLDGFPPTVHELLVLPAIGRAYVPIFGDGVHGRNPNPGHLLCVIDLKRRARLDDIDLDPLSAPHTLRAGPDGLIYLTCETDAVIAVIDPITDKVIDTIDSGTPNAHRLVIASDGERLYTENEEDATVSVIDLPRRKFLHTIATPRRLAGIALSGDNRTVVAVDDEQPTLFLIDPASREVASIRLEGIATPGQIVRYSPDFTRLAITCLKSDAVIVTDAAFRRQTVVAVGHQPMDPTFRGGELFVPCQGDGTVHVIDLEAGRVKRHFDAGEGCEALDFF